MIEKTKEIKDTKKIVLHILQKYPQTRGNYSLLVAISDEYINPSIVGMKYSYVMSHRNDLGLPKVATIERARRWVVNKHPELRPTEAIQEEMKSNEVIFKNENRTFKRLDQIAQKNIK